MITVENSENLAISEAQIAEIVENVASQIVLRYENSNPTLIGVLIGGGRYANAVHEALVAKNFRHTLTWIGARKTSREGKAELVMYNPPSYHLLHKKRVILLDDLLETGRTMTLLGNYLTRSKLKSLEVGALVVKLDPTPEWLQKAYCGFKIPADAPIVVGYGLDYNSNHRDEAGIRLLRDDEKVTEPVAG